jgi:aryl-alcohol dehydrogenase-like predicted oxidoreductase
MDLRERVPLGRTGKMLTRLGLASGYGVPASGIEKAVHEYGVNYLYVSPLLNLSSMVEAVRNLGPGHRDDLLIVLARTYLRGMGGLRLEKYVDRWLKKLAIEQADLILQDVRKPISSKIADRVRGLQEEGKIRFFGISSHDRPLLGRIAKGDEMEMVDFFHVRYNAVHTGAEEDVFPHLREDDPPGTVVFTATCWRKLLKPKKMPPGESSLTAAECYRFVLSNPNVNVCLTAPSNESRMEENFKALDAGPLDEEEMARARRIGEYIYGKK